MRLGCWGKFLATFYFILSLVRHEIFSDESFLVFDCDFKKEP